MRSREWISISLFCSVVTACGRVDEPSPVTDEGDHVIGGGSASTGKPLRVVGYGLDDGVQQTGAGVKRQVLTKLRSIASMLIGVGDTRHGTCNGDSGGPAFMKIDGIETIVGVTSYGNADCSDGGFDARVDTDLAFIDAYLPSACTRVCDGRVCGSDGCGGSCGSC